MPQRRLAADRPRGDRPPPRSPSPAGGPVPPGRTFLRGSGGEVGSDRAHPPMSPGQGPRTAPHPPHAARGLGRRGRLAPDPLHVPGRRARVIFQGRGRRRDGRDLIGRRRAGFSGHFEGDAHDQDEDCRHPGDGHGRRRIGVLRGARREACAGQARDGGEEIAFRQARRKCREGRCQARGDGRGPRPGSLARGQADLGRHGVHRRL